MELKDFEGEHILTGYQMRECGGVPSIDFIILYSII